MGVWRAGGAPVVLLVLVIGARTSGVCALDVYPGLDRSGRIGSNTHSTYTSHRLCQNSMSQILIPNVH